MLSQGVTGRILAIGRSARASRWLRSGGRPRVWAHRGASAHAPENTMAAFLLAKQVGADGIELDVRLDGDGQVVVFHDDTLLRLTGQPGTMETTSSEARKQLRVQGTHHVPTLREVLETLHGIEINIELKVPDDQGMMVTLLSKLARNVAHLLRETRAHDRCLVSSFHPVAIAQMRLAAPTVATALLFERAQLLGGWRSLLGRPLGASALHPEHVLCTRAAVQAWKAAGYAVNVWTVDDADELRRLVRLGVDGVICNDPEAAIAVISAA